MPEAYMIKNSLDDWPTHYAVPGSSNYSIPRVICPDCGEHASAAFRYPSLDVSKLEEKIVRRLRFYNPLEPHGKTKKGPAEITPDEMRDLSELLAPIMGPDQPFGSRYSTPCWKLGFRSAAFPSTRDIAVPGAIR